MLLKFAPPPEHSDCPYRQVHYGYDFSGGAVCDVKDLIHAKKLLGTRHFVAVRPDSDAAAFHAENRPMRRRKRVVDGNDNES